MAPDSPSHQSTLCSIDELLSVVFEEKADTSSSSSSSKDKCQILRCRRPNINDLDAIHEFVVNYDEHVLNVKHKDCNSFGYFEFLRVVLDGRDTEGELIPICIVLEEERTPGSYELKGFASWTFGYSTWKGRVLNLDAFVTSSSGIKNGNGSQKENNRTLMMCLVRMARILDCTRIVHQVSTVIKKRIIS